MAPGQTATIRALLSTGSIRRRLRAIGLHPKESLDANDSYPLLLKAGTLLRTGPTRTNVMDMTIMLVRPK